MTTVLFAHGTGVSNPGYEETFKLIEQKLQAERPDLKVERCLWGDSFIKDHKRWQQKALTQEKRDRILAALEVGKPSAQYKRMKAVLDQMIP